MKISPYFRLLIAIFVVSTLPTSCNKSDPEDMPVVDPNAYILTPDSKGRLDIQPQAAEQYQPGDIIYLRGTFLSVWIKGLKGTTDRPIRVMNYPGEVTTIGNPDWTGGAYASGIQLLECHHIILGGDKTPSDFVVEGSVQEGPQSAYFCVNLRPFTDNIEVKNMTLKNGGTGIIAKTDPDINNPETWHPNSKIENLSIHDLIITGQSEEAMYIGHTSVWWGWDENGKGYNAGLERPDNPAHTFVQPIMWNNVKIYNMLIYNQGYDGIQASAIDNIEIYNNEVYDYGLKNVSSQSAGILVGARSTNASVHDNYVHDGLGELMQIQAYGTNNTVQNNLLVRGGSNGIGVLGSINGASMKVINNTVVHCGKYGVRVNGRNYNISAEISNNLLIEAGVDMPTEKKPYIKSENKATITESGNYTFESVEKANVNPDNFYAPNNGSTIGNAGYRKK